MINITAEDIIKDIGEEPLCVPPETTVYDAVKLMMEKDLHAVLIKKDGEYAGIWTERDLMKNTVLDGYDPKTTKAPIDYAFDILDNVAHHTYTQWRIVYDVKNLSVFFRTLENQNIRYFSLKSFDLSCATPVKVLDVNTELSGDITDKFD